MTRTPPFLLLVFLALTGCAGLGPLKQTAETAAPILVTDLPPVGSYDVDALAEQHDLDDAVYLTYWLTDEHLFGGVRWRYIEDRTAQYVVLNPEEESVTTLTISIPTSDELSGFVARVTSPGGSVQLFGAPDLIVERDGPQVRYKLVLPDIERGSLVERRYRVQREMAENVRPPLYEDYALQFPAPVQSLRVRFITPGQWRTQVKRIAQGTVPLDTSYVDPASGQFVREFLRTDVPAYREEPFSPWFRQTGEYVDLRVTKIGSIYSAPDTWEELGQEYAGYAYRRGRLFSAPVGRATRSALPDRSVSDSLKLVRIVAWAQQTIELGQASRDDLTRMIDEQRGNPIQICALTQAMLDEVGIQSEFLLINPASAGYFDERYVSPSQLTVPAVGATVGGQSYIVFPFLEGLPVTYIPEVFQGARAARITSDGFGGFTTIPTLDREAYAVDEAYDIEIDRDGRISVEETKTLRGIAAYLIRSRLSDLDEDEREAEVRDLLTYTEGDVQDFGYELVAFDEYGSPLEIKLRYGIDNLVVVTPEEVLFQTGGLLSPASLGAFSVDTRERTLPIRIGFDQLSNKQIHIRYPTEWQLTTDLADVSTENAFGEVTGVYRLAPGSVVAEQSVLLRKADAPASDYGDLIRLTGSESDLYVPTLVFTVE